MRLILTAAVIAAIPLTVLAQDDDPIHQAVEARHGFYQMLAINMGTLSGFGWDAFSALCPLGAFTTMLATKTMVPRADMPLA